MLGYGLTLTQLRSDMNFWSLFLPRTFYQLSASLQAEEEAFSHQEEENTLRKSTNNNPQTPSLPANFLEKWSSHTMIQSNQSYVCEDVLFSTACLL